MRKLKEDELWGERLIHRVVGKFEKIPEKRSFSRKNKISLADCMKSCFAVFGFKWPSLLQYQENLKNEKIRKNLRSLYGIECPPSDTYMRERLDEVDPSSIAPLFKNIFSVLQRNKILEQYQYYDGYYLVSIDGTGYFSSEKVHCANCCVKNHSSGKVTYYHQLLGAVMVHPDQKPVIPFCPEEIKKEDGQAKNDCERNAAKRLLARLRKEHPHLKMMVIEDGLASNGPHIKDLERHKMRYILGAKEGDHKFLFDWVKGSDKTEYEYQDEKGFWHRFSFVNQVPLNDNNFDLKVNFLAYEEESPKGKKKKFSWVTNVWLTTNNVSKVMKGGRARWSIENETFNTLKNQGYELEHNYGHGKKNLSTIMSMMMMLAFLVDQVQLLCCQLYRKSKKVAVTFKSLWDRMKAICSLIAVESWKQFYQCITGQIELNTS